MNEQDEPAGTPANEAPDHTGPDADSAASAGSESPEEGQAAEDAAADAVNGHDDA